MDLRSEELRKFYRRINKCKYLKLFDIIVILYDIISKVVLYSITYKLTLYCINFKLIQNEMLKMFSRSDGFSQIWPT